MLTDGSLRGQERASEALEIGARAEAGPGATGAAWGQSEALWGSWAVR